MGRHLKFKRSGAIVVVIAAAASLGFGGPAYAAGTTYYVDNTVSCSDTGSGTSTNPFCTIGKGAAVALAGDTVLVRAGTYTGSSVHPTNSGAAGARITFTANAGVTISGGASAFAITKPYVTVKGFTVSGTTGYGITVSSTNHVTISNNEVTGAGHPLSGQTAGGIKLSSTTASIVTGNTTDDNTSHGIYLASGSSNNTVSYNEASGNAEGWRRNANGINNQGTGNSGNTIIGNTVHDNEDSGINNYTGASSTLVVNNLSYHNGDHGIDDLNTPNQRLISNTVWGNYTAGINVESSTSGGASATIENNISMNNGSAYGPCITGPCSPRTQGDYRVDASSTGSSTVNYNVAYLSSGGTEYTWGSTTYTSLAAFQATGQGARDLEGNPLFVNPGSGNFHITLGSPAVDSADSSVSGEKSFDLTQTTRVDNASTANTGAGPFKYYDRGAYELVP
jgi:parallel beta-helix repeat protein